MTPPPHFQAALVKQSYVYLLKSQKDGKFYLGWTTDVERRLGEHNNALNPYTRSRIPFELVRYETFPSQELAKKRERSLKKNPNMYACFKTRALRGKENEVVG